jgi:hypothetical protein
LCESLSSVRKEVIASSTTVRFLSELPEPEFAAVVRLNRGTPELAEKRCARRGEYLR